MALISIPLILVTVSCLLFPFYWDPSIADAEVLIVVLEDDPVVTFKASLDHLASADDALKYKEMVISRHDIFLDSLLPSGSYTKLYSYTHLFSGFALHTSSEEVSYQMAYISLCLETNVKVTNALLKLHPKNKLEPKQAIEILRDAHGVRVIHADMKMKKMTTHTPDYLNISTAVWPTLGGARRSGEGVVIGLIDTGINPVHPSFTNHGRTVKPKKYKGKCESGDEFPATACNGKIVGAQHFARAAIAEGDFNGTKDHASPFDADGHGSHTASTAAGNYRVPVLYKGYNYGYASGMAPGAQIAVYKAIYSFGGYMSDIVAAVDKAVEDGVDILSLSIGPSAVPAGPASFLNILDMELLFATKAGVFVVQAVGNEGPDSGSILSFSPWITSVAASTTDRKYNNSIILGSGQTLSGAGLSSPTAKEAFYQLAAAEDVRFVNNSFYAVDNCQHSERFNPYLARGKIIICTYTIDFLFGPPNIDAIAETMHTIAAAGFIVAMDRSLDSPSLENDLLSPSIPGIILRSREDSGALWDYYDSNTIRSMNGGVAHFGATGRIQDGRHAIFTGQGPVVASYSSRGPDVDNALKQTADVLKPNIMAPGSYIWAAWSPKSNSGQFAKGQDFALISGTSMATPHVAGIAALIKQKHPDWSPAAITSAMMTTADVVDASGIPILAQQRSELTNAMPFDFGAGFVNPSRALDPGLVFDLDFEGYVKFLCAVPEVDDASVRRALGTGCPTPGIEWCSDLNTASVAIASLVGLRKVFRRVTSVSDETEHYKAVVREPAGVAVRVTPEEFDILPNSTRGLRIVVEAREAINAYTFGEVALLGDKKHVVRIPMAVFASSTLRP